ncbi:DUF2252 domain-containing protein [Flavihumibacter rivuli]|uniref:DUF2252 domain-containing protein n=1 Tax=Flavihumibacter rivuli TaxID=2838156 RepID=UPI001BDE0325|nr:DUF2252 domain-containing protein [Flavihumibacter rivuli]ULQ54879.1 DUF2252 domain-containing protein [Flavihumibacter rivuli]
MDNTVTTNQPLVGEPTPYKVRPTYFHLPRAERYELGKLLREKCPRTSHATWKAPANRPDPVDLMLQADAGRIEKLIPLRHGRMAVSPFTFYRGAALNMAADLATTPNSTMYVQICGDGHLSNFGGFATPEKNIIFSINDLDETLPGPWEWDVKRLAASFVVAGRNNGISEANARDTAVACTRAYREYMATYSEMKTMELWHYSIEAEMLISRMKDPQMMERAYKRIEKEKERSVAEEIFPKLAQGTANKTFIKDSLPEIFHWEGHEPGEVVDIVKATFEDYKKTLTPAHASLLNRYELKDAAIKVVGVGSVGTSCWVLLLMTGDGEPLFLQVKEARDSVLEPYAGKSIYANHGQRVINGYRLMQPFSDPFLGWTKGHGEQKRDFFLRQLRNTKISIRVETFGKSEMMQYAEWCGQALALSHARGGDAAMLSGYMGKSDKFDEAIADFSVAYADQNEQDHAAIKKAIREGRLEAEFEE